MIHKHRAVPVVLMAPHKWISEGFLLWCCLVQADLSLEAVKHLTNVSDSVEAHHEQHTRQQKQPAEHIVADGSSVPPHT